MGKLRKIKEHAKEFGPKETARWLYYCLKIRLMTGKIKSEDFDRIRKDEKEKPFLTAKEQQAVYIFTGTPYYDIGGGQRSSQLAKTFNAMGFDVRFVYAYRSSEKAPDMPVPVSSHRCIDGTTVEALKEEVKENDLFIFESPSPKFKEFAALAKEKKCVTVYENIDNWETSLGSGIFDESALKFLLENAKVLTGTAKPLVSQLKDYLKKYSIADKPVMYLPNAVDDELFCGLRSDPVPADIVKGEVTLLYYGSLWGEWFDWDIVTSLAKKHPKYSFNMIGNASNQRIYSKIRNCPPNVRFLGLKKQSELPAYLSSADFAIVPFKPGDIGDYVSPLKVFEYIAMYKNVLCTPLPDIQGYPNVYIGNTAEEWEDAILNAGPADRKAADAFISENCWTRRVCDILYSAYGKPGESFFKDRLSVVVLNYNNKNVIFRCVESLLRFNSQYNYEIVVVDNGSGDGSYELLKEKYEGRIKILRNRKNGCSSGRNLGVNASNGEYILFLDSDQWATNDLWLLPYENVLKTADNVGLVGWAAGFFNEKNAAYHVVDSFPYRYMPSDCLCRKDIGYLGSGGMLVSKEDFDKVGGYDVNYDPTCYEDTDFSMKIRHLGKELYYCPYLGVIHLPHQTTNSGSEEHTRLIKEKQKYFTEKWEKTDPSVFRYKK